MEHFNLIRLQNDFKIKIKKEESDIKNSTGDNVLFFVLPKFLPTFQLQFPFKFPFNSAPSSTGLDMNVSARSPPRLFQFLPLIVSFCNLLCRKKQIPFKNISFLSSCLSRTFMLSSILLHPIRCSFGTSAYLDIVRFLHSSLLRHESESNCPPPFPPEMTRRYLSKPAPTSDFGRARIFIQKRDI